MDVSDRGLDHLLLVSFTDCQDEAHFSRLEEFLEAHFTKKAHPDKSPEPIPSPLLRRGPVALPSFPLEDLKAFYRNLAHQNLSPDDNLYPLGSVAP